MGRPRKKPEYNPELIQQEMIELAKELYLGRHDSSGKKKNTLSSVAVARRIEVGSDDTLF